MAKLRFSSNEILGARLRFARKNAGMTQKELSERIHIDPRNYSRYESGMSCPPADVLVRLCKALDVTSDFCWESPIPIPPLPPRPIISASWARIGPDMYTISRRKKATEFRRF